MINSVTRREPVFSKDNSFFAIGLKKGKNIYYENVL